MNHMLLETLKKIRRLGQRLGTDTSGIIVTGDYLLLTTIVALGMVVGVASFRNSVVQEFGDISVAMESLDQSYSFTIVNPTGPDLVVNFDEDNYTDPLPPVYFDPTGESDGDGAGEPPAGIVFQEPTGEQ